MPDGVATGAIAGVTPGPEPSPSVPTAQIRAAGTPGGLPETDLPKVTVEGLSALTTVVVTVVIVSALYLTREILVPVILAVLLSFVLAPLVNLIRDARVPRVAAIFLTIAIALCVMLGVGAVIGTQVADLAAKAPEYQQTVMNKVGSIKDFAFAETNRLTSAFDGKKAGAPGGQTGGAAGGPSGPAAKLPGTAADGAASKPNPMLALLGGGESSSGSSGMVGMVFSILGPVLAPLGTLVVVILVAIFILLQREDLRDRLIRLFGSSDLHRTTIAMDDAARRLSRYFITQLCINAGFGVLVTVGLLAIGTPSPILWGILGALMRFVPYVGSAIAAIIPMALAAAVSPGWSMMLETGALFLALDAIIGQGVEPLAYGSSTGLSPVSIVIAALFWSWLWGPIGLIISTPITLCLVVLGRHVEHLEFLDVLLGDRPALTPVETFYQRMLAGDPDEAEEQAEVLLKTRGLTSYYDEVAMKGLQLAAADAQRGVLTPVQMARVKSAVEALIESLSEHEDVLGSMPDATPGELGDQSLAERAIPSRAAPDTAPDAGTGANSLRPAFDREGSILCVAGRGPLDEAAACMLAQLLGKHGLRARVVPQGAVARGAIDRLDLSGVAMVCVSYLELAGSLANVRYLLRRLRARAPDAKLLVGLWPVDARVLQDTSAQAAIGADVFVSNLHDAVNACVHEATASMPQTALAA